MRIVNTTRDTILAERAWRAVTLRERMKGLLGKDKLEEGRALLISPCTSIHSFFMRFRFDAAFVDPDGVVLHMIHSMKKWRMSKWVARARGVIEFPAGVLERSGTQRGDKLKFEE